MPLRRSAAVVLIAGALVMSCTEEEAGPQVVQPGAPGEPSQQVSRDDLTSYEAPGHTAQDVAFVQDMLHHHAQALEMTALVADRTSRTDIPVFAERIDISQEDEMAQMRAWLEARGEEVPALDGHDHHGHGAQPMPGMLSPEEMAALEVAEGDAFDRLFLESMRAHHEGALRMVADLFATGGGEEPELFQLANHIDADQRVEIARIDSLLADLDG